MRIGNVPSTMIFPRAVEASLRIPESCETVCANMFKEAPMSDSIAKTVYAGSFSPLWIFPAMALGLCLGKCGWESARSNR